MVGKFYNIELGDSKFRVGVADDDEKRSRGLSYTKKLGKDKGMLFVFPVLSYVEMVMTDMKYPLDFIFLDKDFNVLQIGSLEHDTNETIISQYPIQMVLEINKGLCEKIGLKVGDKLKPESDLDIHCGGVRKFKHGGKFEKIGDKIYEVKEDDVKIDPTKLQILNKDGEVVANIDPGSRIFSREHTLELIEKFRNGDIEDLGKALATIIDIQDNQAQDYVEN